MPASVAINAGADLVAIAAAAGNADPQGRYYRDGRLYILGVSQAALDAAVAAVGSAASAPVPDLTPLQLRQGLLAAGLLDDVEALIAAGPVGLRLTYQHASVIKREHPMIAALAAQIGLSDAAVDNLFRAAATG